MLARLLLPFILLGSLTVPCLAQSDNGATPAAPPPGPSTSTTANSAPPAPKKVWTNDDLPTGKPGVDKRNQNARPTGQTADPATIERIRKNLEKLQSQLDDVNKKLKSLKDFMEGEAVSTGARDLDKGLNRVPVDQQIIQLQDKKKTIEAELSDLWDEARKKGIDPGQLR